MGINSEYAPIVLFVYNRLEHTKKTIGALRKNHGAENSLLFIYSDGPKEGSEDSVEAVRNFVKEVDGFRNVNIVFREKNIGLAASVIAGVTEVLSRYEKVIVMEDDLVTSRYFLSYMNAALEKYRDCSKVFAITGYSYFDKGNKRLPETYFAKIVESWTWATWKDRWKYFDPEATGWKKLMNNSRLRKKFDYDNSFGFSNMLYCQMKLKNIDSWAIRWAYSVFCQGGLTLYPNKSLCINIGFDGSGVHCGIDKKVRVIEMQNEPICFWPNEILEQPETRKQICRVMKKQREAHILERGMYYLKHPVKLINRFGSNIKLFSGN